MVVSRRCARRASQLIDLATRWSPPRAVSTGGVGTLWQASCNRPPNFFSLRIRKTSRAAYEIKRFRRRSVPELFPLWNTAPRPHFGLARPHRRIRDDKGVRAPADRLIASPLFEEGSAPSFRPARDRSFDVLAKDQILYPSCTVCSRYAKDSLAIADIVDHLGRENGRITGIFILQHARPPERPAGLI